MTDDEKIRYAEREYPVGTVFCCTVVGRAEVREETTYKINCGNVYVSAPPYGDYGKVYDTGKGWAEKEESKVKFQVGSWYKNSNYPKCLYCRVGTVQYHERGNNKYHSFVFDAIIDKDGNYRDGLSEEQSNSSWEKGMELVNFYDIWKPKDGDWVEIIKRETSCNQVGDVGYIKGNPQASFQVFVVGRSTTGNWTGMRHIKPARKPNTNITYKMTAKDLIERGFVEGAQFIELVSGLKWTIKETLTDDYECLQKVPLYIPVKRSLFQGNEIAKIFDGNNWAEIVQDKSKVTFIPKTSFKIWVEDNEDIFNKVVDIFQKEGFDIPFADRFDRVSSYYWDGLSVSYMGRNQRQYFDDQRFPELFPKDLGIITNDPWSKEEPTVPVMYINNIYECKMSIANEVTKEYVDKGRLSTHIENIQSISGKLEKKEKRIYF